MNRLVKKVTAEGQFRECKKFVRNKNGSGLTADPSLHYRHYLPEEDQRHIKARKCYTEQVQNTAGTMNDLGEMCLSTEFCSANVKLFPKLPATREE